MYRFYWEAHRPETPAWCLADLLPAAWQRAQEAATQARAVGILTPDAAAGGTPHLV